MKKLFLLLLTLASTNVLFGVPPQQQRPQPRIQEFIVQRAGQTAQNNTPAQRNQGNATRPLDRRATTDPRMAPFLNEFQILNIPRTLPAPQNINNMFLNRPAVEDALMISDSDDDLLSSDSDMISDSDDDISSISDRTENRDNRNRRLRAPAPRPIGHFMTYFQLHPNAPLQTQTMGTQTDGLLQALLQARNTNDVRRFVRARTAAIFAQVRRNHNQ